MGRGGLFGRVGAGGSGMQLETSTRYGQSKLNPAHRHFKFEHTSDKSSVVLLTPPQTRQLYSIRNCIDALWENWIMAVETPNFITDLLTDMLDK